MKKLLFLSQALLVASTLLVASGAHAATAQVNSVIGLGGGSSANTTAAAPGSADITTPESSLGTGAEWFTLSSTITASSPNYYYHFVKWGTNSGQFKVPTGKTLHCLDVTTKTNTPETSLVLGYATAAFTNNSGTVPTGAQYFGKADTAGVTSSSTAEAYGLLKAEMSFDADMYPFMETMSNAVNYRAYLNCRLTTP